ncbi:MAG: hypothetical protein FRX49_07797 [Trebouxia sp. A1-2]|nr:MAG: hypothetical protein FRX49_07797 [Trebouxia sp. A1-2]
MSAKFLSQGLNVGFIDTARQRYIYQGSELVPLPYANFPISLGSDIVRTELYVNKPERWHITVFHTSNYDDARPNPSKPLAPDLQQSESGHRAPPSSDALHQEHQTIQKLVRQNQPINLEVHRILLADSGTLLVCLIDRNGILNHLREQLTRAFPGAPMRQTQIMHVSVLRLLTAQQLSNEERHRLQAICDEYTIKLKGMQITATELWYVHEAIFANIEGKVHTIQTSTESKHT